MKTDPVRFCEKISGEFPVYSYPTTLTVTAHEFLQVLTGTFTFVFSSRAGITAFTLSTHAQYLSLQIVRILLG
jgi:hypothetical protein